MYKEVVVVDGDIRVRQRKLKRHARAGNRSPLKRTARMDQMKIFNSLNPTSGIPWKRQLLILREFEDQPWFGFWLHGLAWWLEHNVGQAHFIKAVTKNEVGQGKQLAEWCNCERTEVTKWTNGRKKISHARWMQIVHYAVWVSPRLWGDDQELGLIRRKRPGGPGWGFAQ